MYLVAKISQMKEENVVGRIGGNVPQYFLDKVDDLMDDVPFRMGEQGRTD